MNFREKTIRRRLAAFFLFAAIAAVFHVGECYGQSAGLSLGGYNRGEGGHPAYYLAMQARVQYRGVGIEVEHVPTVNTVKGFPVDLFSASLALDPKLGPLVVPLRIGYSRWRDWNSPAKDFIQNDGVRAQAGLGIKFGITRIEVRGSYTEYGGFDQSILFGIEVGR